MNRTLYLFFFCIIWLLFITSCSPVYVPSVLNVPLHNNQREFQAAAHIGVEGFDFHAAYAITDNFGVMLNKRTKTFDKEPRISRWLIEGGVGYSIELEHATRFEFYGGMGRGQFHDRTPPDQWFRNGLKYPDQLADMRTFFLQPSLGISNEYFDAAVTLRSVYAMVHQKHYREGALFIEPVLTLKLGYRYIKGVGQIGMSVAVNEPNYNGFNAQMMVSLGLQATLFRKWD